MSRTLAAVVISSLLVGGCAKQSSAPESEMALPAEPASGATETTVVAEPAPPPPAIEPAPAAAPPVEDTPVEPLSDAQIAKILVSVDEGEIEQAKIAQKKSKNQRVKKFAQHMIQSHTKSKQKGTSLAKKAKITPEDSPVAAKLTGKSTEVVETLKAADATTIDALYIDAQAQQHQEVLDLVSAQLIPAASHDELKSLLSETRTMVESHAAEAKDIQQTLASAAAAPMSPAGSPAAPDAPASGPAVPSMP